MKTKAEWEKFWQERGIQSDLTEEALLWQVGKTIAGQPVGAEQIALIQQIILTALEIRQDDQVLDLGCGNGVMTQRIAPFCQRICGIDFSDTLIDVAKKTMQHDAEYFTGDISDDGSYVMLPETITKIYSYEVFQHLANDYAQACLMALKEKFPEVSIVYIGSVPDADKIRKFYDTDARWRQYQEEQKNGTDLMGHWWTKQDFKALAKAAGFACVIQDQPEALYTSHYRFNAVLKREA